MDEEYSNYYDPEKKRSPLLRIVIIALMILVIFLLLIFFTKACSKGPDLYHELTKMSSIYIDADKLPKELGECNTYTLKDMSANQSDSTKKMFSKCNSNDTYVKVCKVSESDYQYTPVLSCKKIKTQFGEYKTGTVDDLASYNSDVLITFDGEVKEIGDRTYYPNDETNISKVSEYYVTSPKEGYTYKVNPMTAYKWYTEGEEKEYYNNGEYAVTAPDLYSLKEDEKVKTYYTLSKPASESYRSVSNTTLYAIEYAAYPYKYECKDSRYQGTIISNTLCEKRDTGTFGTTVKMHYTCDGKNETEKGVLCKARGNWSANSCKNNDQTVNGTTADGYSYTRNLWTGLTCVETKGYQVSDTVYKWYRLIKVNKYYPSGSKDANEENTYYVTTPVAGASKDEKTETTAYQYFKLVKTENSKETWVSIGDAEMTKEELINSFKELGYNVGSFNEIDSNENTRYQVVIKYRNRK